MLMRGARGSRSLVWCNPRVSQLRTRLPAPSTACASTSLESFEFRLAEIGSGTSKTTGAVALDLKATYGQFAHIHLSNKGRLN